jgi:acetone carboxylase gamma subunit
MRIHYYLEIDDKKKIRCLKCGTVICGASENFKLHVPRSERKPKEIPGRRPTNPNYAVYYEYYCPGCYTMLDVEAGPRGSAPIHDIEVKV